MELRWIDRIVGPVNNDYTSYLYDEFENRLYFAGNNWNNWDNPHLFFGVYVAGDEDVESPALSSLEEAKQWCEMHYATGAGK